MPFIVYCTASLTSLSDSLSFITCLFLEWRVGCMAPAYANLFMGDLEKKYLPNLHSSPSFVGNILMTLLVLIHREDKLKKFITHLNSSHNTTKVTHEFSNSSISFLDVTISLDNSNQMSIDLFVKSTDFTNKSMDIWSFYSGRCRGRSRF